MAAHPHLVKLIGYCCQDENKLLVYEYIAQGNLENHLFGRYSVSLPWLTRLKIALGAVKGLAIHATEHGFVKGLAIHATEQGFAVGMHAALHINLNRNTYTN
ncbi:hypothetical protein AgCh_035899 [Apium graveolens]